MTVAIFIFFLKTGNGRKEIKKEEKIRNRQRNKKKKKDGSQLSRTFFFNNRYEVRKKILVQREKDKKQRNKIK